ncbi:glycosyltransferase [Candidatus Woesearchaeota archaeon]|nr:glycosyltransferase [Candidatus Woesearchaeota archaeon]
MKIAILTDSFYPEFNGLVTSLLQTSKALAEKGHHILIITAKYPDNNEIFIHKNIEIVRLASISFFTYKGMRIILPKKKTVMKELKLFHPDLIHVHGVTTPYALRYAKFHTIPIIATFHSLYTEQIEYIMPHRLLGMHHLFKRKNDIKTNNLTRYQTTKSFVWKILRKYYSKFNLTIAPSIAIKNELIEKSINKRIEVISNGIDLKRFSVKKDYSPKNKILHFGRISYERNVDILVKAFDNFLKRNNREDIELHIIGNGPEFEKINKLVKELGRENTIKLFGYLPRETIINDFLANYDFAITTSTMETQSMMILESFAAGLPVIGVDKYAIPDLVRHEYTGFIARAFDIEELAYYMEKMYSSDSQELLQMLGTNARKEAEKHDLQIVVSQLEGLYNKIIAENRIIV